MNSESESARLEGIAADSWYARGANGASVLYSAKVFSRHWKGQSCLELGPAEGLMTKILASRFTDLTLVDGSKQFCDALQVAHPNAKIQNSLFEEFNPDRLFDTIVLGHVLEHVENPVGLLARAAKWLSPNGVICAAVPNSRSLHRQAAVLMGMLAFEETLNQTDLHHGHRRVFNPETFRAAFREAGLSIHVFGGYWIKPLSIAQIDQHWTPEMLEAFMVLGERYPDIAGEIYVIAIAR